MSLLQFQALSGPYKQQQLMNAVYRAIYEKRLRLGEKLPSLRELAVQFNVHRNTVHGALNDLVAQGLLESRPKKGFYVAEEFKQLLDLQYHAPSPSLPATNPKVKYDLRSGTSDLRHFDLRAFKHHFNRAVGKMTYRDFEYGFTAGHPHLLEGLQYYLQQMRALPPRPLLITNGSQEALYLLSQHLLRPSDKSALPELSYINMKKIACQQKVNIIPIKLDQDGLNTDDLADKLQQHSIKFLYITPHNQYPTTVTLPLKRRLHLLELAKQHNFYILEDDYAHEFSFTTTPPTLVSIDKAECVCYLSSFSKVLLPSMRIGFIALPEKLYQPILNLKELISRQNEVFIQLTLAKMIFSGYFEQYLHRLRKVIKNRRDFLVGELHKYSAIKFTTPKAGLNFWLNTGKLTSQLINKATIYHILIESEDFYRIDNIGVNEPQFIRLGFAKYNEQELAQILAKLFEN